MVLFYKQAHHLSFNNKHGSIIVNMKKRAFVNSSSLHDHGMYRVNDRHNMKMIRWTNGTEAGFLLMPLLNSRVNMHLAISLKEED